MQSRSHTPRLTALVLTLFLLQLAAGSLAAAIDIGGELAVDTDLSLTDQLLSVQARGRGRLEVFLPDWSPFRTRLVFRTQLDAEPELGVQYLYLRYHHDNGHITLGRQPLSWSCGAILQPFGYGLNIEGVAGETATPSADAIRSVYSLGHGRSFEAAAHIPDGLTAISSGDIGYGIRLRLPTAGSDISINASSRPIELPAPVPGQTYTENLIRAGLTYSGDVGPLGVYGAIGSYRLQEAAIDDIVGQLGIDYSWRIGPAYARRLVYLQLEYLRFLRGELGTGFLMQLGPITNDPLAGIPGGNPPSDRQSLLIASTAVDLDHFTSIGAALVTDFSEGLLLMPYVQTDLGGNLELRLQGSALRFDDMRQSGITLSLHYYF